MYSFIKGTYVGNKNQYVVVEASGVGYKICCGPNTIAKMPKIGEETKIHTYLNVREDALELYGFYTEEELEMFETLTSVSGVGPKVGIAILSYVSPKELVVAIGTDNAKPFTKAPGVGPKLAKRIILELKDKFKNTSAEDLSDDILITQDNSALTEAKEALMALGYSSQEASKAVMGLSGSVEDIISTALKNLMSKR